MGREAIAEGEMGSVVLREAQSLIVGAAQVKDFGEI